MGIGKNVVDAKCGGQSINRPIKVRIVGPVAYPRMHIRPRSPSQVIRVITEGG